MKPMWIAGSVIVVLCVLAVCVSLIYSVVTANNKATSIAKDQQAIQRVLIRSCQDNGNPLRTAVIQILEDQIDQTKHPALFRQAFPSLSDKRLFRLIHKANKQRREVIRRLHPVNCHAIYHKGS